MNALMSLRRLVPAGLTAATLLAASLVHAQGVAPTAPVAPASVQAQATPHKAVKVKKAKKSTTSAKHQKKARPAMTS